MSAGVKIGIARWFPNPELLNLTFGLAAGVAINLLTSVGTGGVPDDAVLRVQISGWVLLFGSITVGGLAVITGRLRSEALDGVGSTLSAVERRAEVVGHLAECAVRLTVLGVAAVASFAIGLMVLTL